MPLAPLPNGRRYLNKFYPGWNALFDKLDTTMLRAKDVNRILGISSRVLNDWEKRGVFQTVLKRDRSSKTDGWRQYKITDLIALGILREAKKQGVPITTLQSSMDMLFGCNDMLSHHFHYLVYGLDVFFYTNLDDWFGYHCREPEDTIISLPIDHVKVSGFILIIPLNDIVKRIFTELNRDDFKPVRNEDGIYRFIINGVPLALEDLRQGPKQYGHS